MKPATDRQIEFMRTLKIPAREGITSKEASVAIESVLNKDEEKDEEKVEVVKIPGGTMVGPVVKTNGNGSMYTSYAKDIFVAMNSQLAPEDAMELAIKLVKQAKEAFE